MSTIRVINKTRNSVLGTRVEVADRWWPRLRGLLGRPSPEAGEGLLLSPCRAIHTWGMGFPVDVVFLDREGMVVAAYSDLRPRRRTGYHVGAEHALEVPAGTIAATGTCERDVVVWTTPEADWDGARDPARQQHERARSTTHRRGRHVNR